MLNKKDMELMLASEEANTYGWDTVFAIDYNAVNMAMTKSWPDVPDTSKNFNELNEGYTIAGSWKPWQIALGGDGKNIRLNCAIENGTFTRADASTLDITGANVEIEINLDYVPDPSNQNSLKLMVDPSGTAAEPAAIVISISHDPAFNTIDEAIMKEQFQTWFIANLGEFNHVFHIVDIADQVDKDDKWAWVTPTSTSYAVTDEGTMDSSVFAVLTMVQNRPKPLSHQVSPFAIPENSSSGFLISGENYVQNMMLDGAILLFYGATASDFVIDDDGLSVTNKSALQWNVVNDKGHPVSLDISPNNFRMSLLHSNLQVEFTDVVYDTWMPGVTIHINYKEQMEMTLKDRSDGNKVLWLERLKNGRTASATAVTSREVEIAEIVLEFGLAIGGAVLGGVVGGLVGKAVATGASEATVTLTSEAIEVAVTEAGTEAAAEATAEAGAEAAGEVVGKLGKLSGVFERPFAKILGGVIGSGGGFLIGKIPTFIKLASESNFDELPAFDEFAQKCLDKHQWPNQSDYKLNTAELNSSLQLGGDITWK